MSWSSLIWNGAATNEPNQQVPHEIQTLSALRVEFLSINYQGLEVQQMNAYEILAKALREDWTCERVATELEAIGLTKKQVSDVMKQEILRGTK